MRACTCVGLQSCRRFRRADVDPVPLRGPVMARALAAVCAAGKPAMRQPVRMTVHAPPLEPERGEFRERGRGPWAESRNAPDLSDACPPAAFPLNC